MPASDYFLPGDPDNVDLALIPESITEALANVLPAGEISMWLTATNTHLDGQRPIDVLAADEAAVLGAAELFAAASGDLHPHRRHIL